MLSVEGISFIYREKPVLENVDLEVNKGEIIGILGPNGCGKTTLLKLLNRNLHPQSGKITMDDTDLEDISKKFIARQIAVVPQSNEIRFAFTVRDIVTMGRMPFLDSFKGESSDDMRIVEEAMEKTSITEFADRLINNMSGGERQRVIIARAIAQRAEHTAPGRTDAASGHQPSVRDPGPGEKIIRRGRADGGHRLARPAHGDQVLRPDGAHPRPQDIRRGAPRRKCSPGRT